MTLSSQWPSDPLDGETMGLPCSKVPNPFCWARPCYYPCCCPCVQTMCVCSDGIERDLKAGVILPSPPSVYTVTLVLILSFILIDSLS